jgi:hypothetical protein
MRAAPGAGSSRRRASWTAPIVALLCAALAASASASSPARTGPVAGSAAAIGAPGAGATGAGATVTRLSDLRSLSRWAYPTYEAPVRAAPSSQARRIAALRLLTVDGQAALYVALDAKRLASGETWIRIEVPGRPNGRTGWVPRGALGPLHAVNGHLLVDERRLRATLFRGGRAIFSAPVGVGKASTVTPTGRFYVMEKLTTAGAPLYGPFALGTSAYAPTLSEWPGGGVVGIHGTNEPQLIPGRPSHGCVRMRNADITRLWSLVGLGTPIEIV